jgi:RecA-family ATPase
LLPVLNAADLEGRSVPPRESLVEGLIPRRVVTLLGGDGGTGKSLLALQLAVAVQLGSNWAGRLVFGEGPVLFISAEDDSDELHRRLAAILEEQGSSFDQLKSLHMLSLVGEDALLAAIAGDNTLAPTQLFHALEGRIRALRPVLVILDTLSDLFGGDENSRLHARQFIGLLRGLTLRYETNIILLAHPS